MPRRKSMRGRGPGRGRKKSSGRGARRGRMMKKTANRNDIGGYRA